MFSGTLYVGTKCLTIRNVEFFQKEVEHILCQAVVQPDNKVIAIIELHRDRNGFPFHEEDEEISCSYLVWGGIALHYAHLFLSMNKQKKLNEFLLAVVKYSDFKCDH